MIIGETLPFVTAFIEKLDAAVQKIDPEAGLTRIQKGWLGFCVLGVMVTNSVCWKRFERAGMGRRTHASLSWMFRQTNRFWKDVLRASVTVIVEEYGIPGGIAVIDETDKPRSKSTKRLYKTHKLKDKASGGTINGQCLVFLVLVTPVVTIPVGVEFYMPDPAMTAWYKHTKALKKRGVAKAKRPPKPDKNPLYPTKQEIALRLLVDFRASFPQIRLKCVLADTLYGTETFLSTASATCGDVQVISQLRKNQHIRLQKSEMSVETYFRRHPGTPHRIRIRGGMEQTVLVGSARLYVCAHKTKRFVIALKYEGEEEYRYVVASVMSWRTLDIVQAYTFRWLVEVFFQDWKSYEGWGQLTKQPDEEGSRRSLILSLLCDHCLLLHPEQLARLEHKQPAWTVGSLQELVKVESLLQCVCQIVSSEDPQSKFEQFARRLEEVFTPASSTKHMVGRDLGRLEPTPSLVYRAKVVMKAA
jgi:hypothetical protein